MLNSNFSLIASPGNVRSPWSSAMSCQPCQFVHQVILQIGQYGYQNMHTCIIGIRMKCSSTQYNTEITKDTRKISGRSQVDLQKNKAHAIEWQKCEHGKFICGMRTKVNHYGYITAIEFRCCDHMEFSQKRPKLYHNLGKSHNYIWLFLCWYNRFVKFRTNY